MSILTPLTEEQFREEILKYIPDQDVFVAKLDSYNQKIQIEFEQEWSKQKFKWFFPKRRKEKLRVKIWRKYSYPIFDLVDDCIETMLPKAMDNCFFEDMVDIKDVTLGNKDIQK